MLIPMIGKLSLSKILTTFTPGVIMFALGAEDVARNPLTVDNVALMIAGGALLWFGREMLRTRDVVGSLSLRVTALEDVEKVKIAATATAAAVAQAVLAVRDEHRNLQGG
jgi:hypothetical protein